MREEKNWPCQVEKGSGRFDIFPLVLQNNKADINKVAPYLCSNKLNNSMKTWLKRLKGTCSMKRPRYIYPSKF
jgi:hypothetical protein